MAAPARLETHDAGLSGRRILAFWAPLAATWLMMAAEGPFLTALVARLAVPTYNLAAFGVALSLAMFVEAPIVMIMSAATALARDRASFLALRRFIYTLNAGITAFMLVLLAPPVFRVVAERVFGLPPDVAALAHLGLALLLPWPAAIGYRRFYQGVLIRHGLPRRVAYGTVVRLCTMALVGAGLYFWVQLPGVAVGALALSAGVTLEAAASWVMARATVRRLLAGPEGEPPPPGAIAAFYWPLALTSLLTFGMQPVLTFFVAQSRNAIESLAVLPVLNAFLFIFRSPGLALQETVIALIGTGAASERRLREFGRRVGVALTGALGLVAFTPLAALWLSGVAGLSAELTRLAIAPLRLLCLMPALEALLAWQRSLLLVARRTRVITWGTAIEITGAVAVLAVAIRGLDVVGVTAAALALLLARLAANGFLAAAASR